MIKKIKYIAFRVDVNKLIGFGHLNRVIYLANYLIKKNLKIVLITKTFNEINLLKNKLNLKFTLEEAKNNFSDVIKILKKHNCKILISDISYKNLLKKKNFFIKYNNILEENKIKTISFDDANQLCSSDISFIPYQCKSIKAKKQKKTRVYSGLQYTVLPVDYKKFIKYKIKKNAKNILVVLGGSGNYLILLDLISILNKISKFKIKIFIGGLKKNQVSKILKKINNENIEHINKFQNIFKLLRWSDVALVGAGLIRYETLASRTPGFFINNVKNLTNVEKKMNVEFGNLKILNFLDKRKIKVSSQIIFSYLISKQKRLINFKNSKNLKFNQSLKIINNFINLK